MMIVESYSVFDDAEASLIDILFMVKTYSVCHDDVTVYLDLLFILCSSYRLLR